jgi:hypothetical protein
MSLDIIPRGKLWGQRRAASVAAERSRCRLERVASTNPSRTLPRTFSTPPGRLSNRYRRTVIK